jgi:hypothetical protein
MSTIVEPPTQELTQEGTSLQASAAALVIRDSAGFERAAEMLRAIKVYLRRVSDVFDPICDAAFKAHKTACAQRDGMKRHAVEAETAIKGRMATWEQEQERLRREAEAAAQRERERLEAEALAVAQAEQKRLRDEAQEKILREALEHEAAGDTEAATFLLEEPVYVPVVTPAPVFTPPVRVAAPPRVDGVSFRDTYRAEVTDLMALVQAVAKGQAPLTLLKADETALNGMARSLKTAMKVPGVRVVTSRTVAARA